MTPTRKHVQDAIAEAVDLAAQHRRAGNDKYTILWETILAALRAYEGARSDEPVATVKSNNIPDDLFGCGHWLCLVSTAPNVMLDVGTKLFTHPAPSHVASPVNEITAGMELRNELVALMKSPVSLFHNVHCAITKFDAAIAGKEV